MKIGGYWSRFLSYLIRGTACARNGVCVQMFPRYIEKRKERFPFKMHLLLQISCVSKGCVGDLVAVLHCGGLTCDIQAYILRFLYMGV